MSLGNKILELRKKIGLSQEQLGEKVNVTRQTISNWELGETAPNPEQLKLLSQIFHISVDELLDNDISHVLVERVSNTEKLAGIVIKILKIIGIALFNNASLLSIVSPLGDRLDTYRNAPIIHISGINTYNIYFFFITAFFLCL